MKPSPRVEVIITPSELVQYEGDGGQESEFENESHVLRVPGLHELTQMSRADLVVLQFRVIATINDITARLDAAKLRLRETGIHADANWYRRATQARHIQSSSLKRIQVALQNESERQSGITERKLKNYPFLEAYIRAAKSYLSPKTHAHLVKMAEMTLRDES